MCRHRQAAPPPDLVKRWKAEVKAGLITPSEYDYLVGVYGDPVADAKELEHAKLMAQERDAAQAASYAEFQKHYK